MKKISVIIPCYNVASYIDRCILSVTVQTIGMDALEIICIDDGSVDGTWEALQRWEQLFPDHVLLIRQMENKGLGATRNIGLQYASADWVAFVDADDWLEPDYFQLLYDPVLHVPCDVVSCEWGEKDSSVSLTYFDEEKRQGSGEERYIMADSEEKTKWVLVSGVITPTACGKIIRKDLLIDHHLFFPEGLAYEDRYWYPLLRIYTKRVYTIGKRLYHYFDNPHSITASRNAEHHKDWILLQLKKRMDYEERKLFERYQAELEFDFLCDAIDFVSVLLAQYDHPSFSLFQLEQQFIQEQISDYRSNPYVSFLSLSCLSGLYAEALYSPFDKDKFETFVRLVKEYWKEAVHEGESGV